MTDQQFAVERQTELHNLLRWWMKHMVDDVNGGFYGRIDGQNNLHPSAEKGVILNTRILWAFSAAARKTGNSDYIKMATRAHNYLIDKFLDKEQGGVYWSVDFLGQPLQTKKQVYAQAFAIYALSEFYLLTGNASSLEIALNIFQLLEKNALDPTQNGYYEAYSKDWQLLDDLRLSDKDANEAKTQNTHLHLLEAYANLLRAVPRNSVPEHVPRNSVPGHVFRNSVPELISPEQSSGVQHALENLINLFLEKFIDPKTAHIHLFFDENWQLKSDIVSFGHDIEASWLIWDAAQTIENQEIIEKVKPVCLRIAEITLQEALEPDGSVINQRWNSDGRLDTDRIWWVQAEAIVGFWNAFRMTGDTRFRKAALDCWRFTYNKMRDPVGGEWYWRISAAGENYPEEDKAGFWKCPYHNARAMLH